LLTTRYRCNVDVWVQRRKNTRNIR